MKGGQRYDDGLDVGSFQEISASFTRVYRQNIIGGRGRRQGFVRISETSTTRLSRSSLWMPGRPAVKDQIGKTDWSVHADKVFFPLAKMPG